MAKKQQNTQQLAFSWEELPNLQQKPKISQLAEQQYTIAHWRVWLLDWGKQHNYPAFSFAFSYPPCNEDEDRRFGLLYKGKAAWLRDTQPPYNQREHYSGEWLVKAMDQCKRFDSGECSMPWQISRLQIEKGNEQEVSDGEV